MLQQLYIKEVLYHYKCTVLQEWCFDGNKNFLHLGVQQVYISMYVYMYMYLMHPHIRAYMCVQTCV